jgi:NADPH2:quinone reductase
VARLTGGVGVDFAIDGIGGTTLAKTLGCVRRFGLVASIGQAAGPIPSVAVEALGPVRSLSLARPSVMAYATEKASYAAGMAAVIAMLAAGGFAEIGPEYALANAGKRKPAWKPGRRWAVSSCARNSLHTKGANAVSKRCFLRSEFEP